MRGERAADGGVGVFGATKAVGEYGNGPAVVRGEEGRRGSSGNGGVEEQPKKRKIASLSQAWRSLPGFSVERRGHCTLVVLRAMDSLA